MHTQRALLITASIIGAVFIFGQWATVPFLGKVSGINNGAGILCYGIILVLSCLGTMTEMVAKGIKAAIAVLGVCIAVSCMYYISNVTDASQRMVAASTTIYGSVLSPNIFSVQPAAYLTAVTAGIIIILAFIFTGEVNVEQESEV